MDALTFDQMLPEYQERQKDAARSRMIDESENSAPSPPSPSPSPTSEEAYEADIGGSGTVPVQDEVDSMSSDSASGVSNEGDLATRKSTSSSSSSVQDSNSSLGTSSFFLPSSISPTINYKRDIPQQKLIAVIGRQFDGPDKVADSLQMLVSSPDANSGVSLVKFVPFTLKRKTLLKGVYNGDELKEHDLICMCYNASEARLLLTGTDGYYTSLLKHIESVLGPNKVAFLITSYKTSDNHDNSTSLISPSLKTRLYHKESLRGYLEGDQILSWLDSPSEAQAERLIQLANLETNPQNLFTNQCSIL